MEEADPPYIEEEGWLVSSLEHGLRLLAGGLEGGDRSAARWPVSRVLVPRGVRQGGRARGVSPDPWTGWVSATMKAIAAISPARMVHPLASTRPAPELGDDQRHRGDGRAV